MRQLTRSRPGMTLPEVLVVISLIGVLMGLALPAVQRVRGAAARAQCQNQLKQLALACQHYHDGRGTFPVDRGVYKTEPATGALSWLVHLLPYVEQGAVWEEARQASRDYPIGISRKPDATLHPGHARVVKAYLCPADGHVTSPRHTPSGDFVAFASYVAVSGGDTGSGTFLPGVIPGGARVSAIRDGTSNTLLVGERPPPYSLQAGQWYCRMWHLEPWGGPNTYMSVPAPREFHDVECSQAGGLYGPGNLNNPCDRYHFWSQHGGGANFALADGAVRFVPYTARGVLAALATRAGGETAEVP